MSCTRKEYVAQMQAWVGLNESDGSHKKIVDIYNNIKPLPVGYKLKYTDAWCAGTVSAAAQVCDATDIVPCECSCPRMITLAQKMGIWVEADNHVPTYGDIVLYDWDDSGVGDNKGGSDHVGVVEKVSGNDITVIEGNYSNAVKRRIIEVNGRYIRGYIVPKFAVESEEEKPMKKIYINPGHSDKDPGAVGYETERSLNVRTANFMNEHLLTNYTCETMVTAGSNNSTTAVSEEANKFGADLFVSIHNNAGGGDGYEALVYSSKRKSLGQIFEKHVKAAGQNSRGVKYRPDLTVLRLTDMPAVLNEGAFVDNKKDIQDWNDDAELKKLGVAYAEAAAEYLELDKKAVAPAPAPTPVPEKEYVYRVQVGAYSKKSGADTMLAKLKAAGFGGIIVKSEK